MDYAPINTHRRRIRYSVLGQQHVMTWRFGRGVYVPTAVDTQIEQFLAAMQPLLHSSFVILSADAAAADSEVFLPVAYAGDPPMGGVTEGDSAWRPMFGSFVGRSEGGSRCVIQLFGVMTSPFDGGSSAENDYRLSTAENPAVAGAVGALNSETSKLTGIDATPAVWYAYMNIGVNAYYQRKARRG